MWQYFESLLPEHGNDPMWFEPNMKTWPQEETSASVLLYLPLCSDRLASLSFINSLTRIQGISHCWICSDSDSVFVFPLWRQDIVFFYLRSSKVLNEHPGSDVWPECEKIIVLLTDLFLMVHTKCLYFREAGSSAAGLRWFVLKQVTIKLIVVYCLHDVSYFFFNWTWIG